jgi:hypothetical protein
LRLRGSITGAIGKLLANRPRWFAKPQAAKDSVFLTLNPGRASAAAKRRGK